MHAAVFVASQPTCAPMEYTLQLAKTSNFSLNTSSAVQHTRLAVAPLFAFGAVLSIGKRRSAPGKRPSGSGLVSLSLSVSLSAFRRHLAMRLSRGETHHTRQWHARRVVAHLFLPIPNIVRSSFLVHQLLLMQHRCPCKASAARNLPPPCDDLVSHASPAGISVL